MLRDLLNSMGYDGNKAWYEGLVHVPVPPLVFAIAWGLLYVCIAASVVVYGLQGGRSVAAYVLYFSQVALNAAWSPIFFRWHRIRLALLVAVLLLATVVATTVFFWRDSVAAGALLVPYIAWLAFAVFLSAYIVVKNPPVVKSPSA